MNPVPVAKLTVLAIAAGLAAAPLQAQTTTSSTTTTTISSTTTTVSSTTPPSESTTANSADSKLAASFSNWAGSPENATSLVNGLRTGTAITLTSGSAQTGTPSGTTVDGTAGTTTFTPPTKPMGYGNIRIALSLAQQQLASQGITQPTPQQLQTALVGGELNTSTNTTGQTVSMQGVLEMRASGMGWGKIANTTGYKLGAVMSGKAATTPTSSGSITTAAGSTTGTGQASHGKADRGIVTAAGSGSGASSHGHGKASSGIVTATGSMGGGITTGMSQGHAYGHSGVVTANGGGTGHGQGGGLGNGKGGK